MLIKVIVFDFDGTLIDSNQLKYDAFFKLFPSDVPPRKIIAEVLDEILEESRYIILKEILKKVNSKNINEDELDYKVQGLANKYNDIVVDGAKHCSEKPSATKVLKHLSSKYRLYLSSTTPEDDLRSIVTQRGWDIYFRDIFGYPNKKSDTLIKIINQEGLTPDKVLVVGDGGSDKLSTDVTGCGFFYIQDKNSLEILLDQFK